ncbi:MAG: site-specific DNA-methyltransferase, partial [Firmicutes bacterium]|nr:site-specific DNA-methyltransferase [Bacillota bacterium]
MIGHTFSFPEQMILLAQAGLEEQTRFLAQNAPRQRFHLIYWDPPFFTGRQWSGDAGSFEDQWTSLADYLKTVERQMALLAPWLHERGFFALHCDWHASHYLKALGDKLFGYENFRNEIVWHYSGRRQPAGQHVNAKHDVILLWAAGRTARFYPVFEPWTRDEYVRMKKQKVHCDEDGREWIWGHQGRGKAHAYRIYLDEAVARGRAIDTVWDIPIINPGSKERLGYPTQKPLALLERLVQLCTEPGNAVADFMAGSGTTGIAAVR